MNRFSPITADNFAHNEKNQNDQKIIRNKIYVYNLDWSVHENLLKKFFTKFGQVKKCKIIRDLLTNKSKGFGFVEFLNENDVANVFVASKTELTLLDREINIDYYRERDKSSKNKSTYIASSPTPLSPSFYMNNTTITINNSGENINNQNEDSLDINIQELPYNVLALIFSKLTIRDLCMIERVCKRWNEIANYVWRTKNSLILNQKCIFGDYVRKNNTNAWGLGLKNDFDFGSLKSLMRKKVGFNLKHLDLSEYATQFGVTCLTLVAEECPNLTNLNISKINTSNYNFVKMVKKCTKLKELNMSYCSQISDPSLSKLFQYCKDLEKLDITFCHLITGKCFLKWENNLKSLTIDQCENLSDENLLVLFSKNKNFTYLSMKRSSRFWNATLLSIINNMSKLKYLNLADSGFDSLSGVNIENIRFENLNSLTSLDLSNSSGDNELTSLLLRNSFALKSLNLSYCYKITDDLFINAKINCPLEDLNLNFISQVSDETLKSLCQITNTLKRLHLKGCSKITNEGISRALLQFTFLEHLDIRSNYKIDNSILDTAINLNSKIEILCNDTSIDTVKFVYKYDGTIKELIDRNYFRFKYKNLIFESSLFEPTKFRKNSDQVKIWEAGGFYYIGSPLGTEDEDYYDDENDEGLDNYLFNDDYDGNDDDFFDDAEEQEMLRELDE